MSLTNAAPGTVAGASPAGGLHPAGPAPSAPQSTASIDNSLGFVLDSFVDDVDGVRFAQTVSADGMHLAASSSGDRERHETFAAIASGLASLADGAVDVFGAGSVNRHIIEASDGWILLSRISNTASIGVVADRTVDLGAVGYEMTLLSKRLGAVLSPDVIAQLKRSIAQPS